MKTSELTGTALDWAVAKCEGRELLVPKRATNEDVESMSVPFTLYEVNCFYSEETPVNTTVTPITVTRYGIDDSVGATAPSISFTGGDGRRARGSVDLFFLSRESAVVEARLLVHGGLDDYSPSTNWEQGGPIIEREKLVINYFKADAVSKEPFCIAAISLDYAKEDDVWVAGPTALIAAMRCFVASKLGDEVEIPKDLI